MVIQRILIQKLLKTRTDVSEKIEYISRTGINIGTITDYSMEHILFCVAAAAIMPVSAAAQEGGTPIQAGSPAQVIPAPRQVEYTEGTFTLPEEGAIFYIDGMTESGLDTYLEGLPMNLAGAAKPGKADILIKIASKGKDSGEDESYSLTVTPGRIEVRAGSEAGAFYAVQTLLQMTREGKVRQLRCCKVEDSPRFGYRGLHFDVSRHFRSKEFLMKQMDAMALLKLNKMHLHLTDGAGWRIEIDKYPELTGFAAWRPYKTWQEWWEGGREYCRQSDPEAHGGYYTKDDIREILAYAAPRHIEVIPEIEMPGHSEEVLAAYPELSCSGEPYKDSDFCPGKEDTFTFLENVLAEVMELFPSEYVHIGGDEASKSGWKDCPDCRRRMEEEGLKDVDELQSYLIHRIEEFVNSKGKKIIGWDEILQGGLAPNATVMSWRGTEGGIKALKSGHDVIMTPASYCYLDYTQDAPFKEPASIGGYVPLAKTYSYEPVEEGVTEEEAENLLGVQGNLWAEYITLDSHAEYMYYPRAFAVAETGWTPAGQKDYAGFRERAIALCDQLKDMGYTTFDLRTEYGDRKESQVPVEHLAKGCKVTYGIKYADQYPASGDGALTDGICGGWTYGDLKWQGFFSDADVTVDLGSVKPVHYIGATFMNAAGAWVHIPQKMEVYVSEDGVDFRPAGTVWQDISEKHGFIFFKQYSVICNEKARYVRIYAQRASRPGACLFLDEVIIN